MTKISQSKTTDSQLDSEIDKKKIFYDKSLLLSKNGLFNFCLGARGTGKTFAFKSWALTSEKQTVWVRRYQEDIDDLKDKFLGDMYAEGVLQPEDDVKIDSDILYIGGFPKIYFVALSTSQRKKSQSYHNVDKIIYDEVFEGVGNRRYLRNEVDILLELYETVNRLRLDGRRDCRVFLLSNKTTFVNPYFTYWGILPFTDRFKSFKSGLIVVENYENQEFVNLKKQSKFGQLIAGTKYGDYAIDNMVWLDDDAFLVDSKPDKARLLCNIRFEDLYIGMWVGKDEEILYFMKQYNKDKFTYTTMYEAKDDEFPLAPTRNPLKLIKQAYELGLTRFENNVIKQVIFTIIQQGGKL